MPYKRKTTRPSYSITTQPIRAIAEAVASTAMMKRPRGRPSTKIKVPTKNIVSRLSRAIATNTLTQTKKQGNSPEGEYSTKTVSLGRPTKQNLRNLWKVQKGETSSTITRMNIYSQFAGVSGAVNLVNTSATPTSGTFLVPMYMFDLSASPNVVNGVTTFPNIGWSAQFGAPNDTTNLTWLNGNPLSLENTDSPTTAYNSYPMGGDRWIWSQIKLMFYAPTTIPSRFQVDIVQFNDVRLVPGNDVTNFTVAFYQSFIKKFAFSPLEPGNSKYSKYIKTLYSTSFILNPKESTESVSTIYKQLNIFKYFNRNMRYNWDDQDRMNMIQQENQVNTGVDNKTVVHPRARIFLVIRAQARNGTAYSSTIHPSFDIMLRNKHEQSSS